MQPRSRVRACTHTRTRIRVHAGTPRDGIQRGFTLIELLVALFITAIMLAIGYGAVNQAATGRVAVEQRSARIMQVQQAMRTLETDLALLQPRPVRDPLGGGDLGALVAGSQMSTSVGSSSGGAATATTASSLALQSTALLSLTRGGWANPTGLARPEEERVSYQIENNKLVRYHQPVLDAMGETTLVRQELLDDVTAMSFRYMNAGHVWAETWQVSGAAREQLRHRPVAVEVTVKLKDFGTLVRVVEIAG